LIAEESQQYKEVYKNERAAVKEKGLTMKQVFGSSKHG
jgi:hypothetical protein